MLNEVFTVHLGTRALNYLCTGRHNTKATTTLANGIVLHAARNMLLHPVWECFSDGWSMMLYSPGFLQAAAPGQSDFLSYAGSERAYQPHANVTVHV